ncbi:MAG: LytTR family DNA-binding domain-containing protein [Bacteroidota bacterium]
MKTKCLIVDDEPLAIEIIESYLKQLDDFEVVATCKNALQAFTVLQNEPVDLVFLDIQMPQITGVEFVKSMKQKPGIIFTTAHIDYAVESYELDILDYLVKPISLARFMKAIQKYQAMNKVGDLSAVSPKDSEKDFIYVKSNKKNFKVTFSEILYVESVKDYVKIVASKRQISVKTTLSEFVSRLPEERFLRVHRSFIVNIDRITAHTHHDVELGDKEIPIGGSYKQKVLEVLI